MTKALLRNIGLHVLPRIAWIYLWATALTSRVKICGAEHPDRLRAEGSGFIYAFWHNRQIFLPIIRRGEPIHCLISSSRDGEYVARIAELFGKFAIRGSSTRGGFEAMKQMMKALNAHEIVAVTPDGPRGPPLIVKPGVIQMAGSVSCPIVPMAFDASRKKEFASWDRFCLPYPFGRIAIVFGSPVVIDPSEPVESGCQRLQKALDAATAEASRRAAGQ